MDRGQAAQNAILIDTSSTEVQDQSKVLKQKEQEEAEMIKTKKKNSFAKFTEKLKAQKSDNLRATMLNFIKEIQNNEKLKTKETKEKVSNFINDFEIEFQSIWKEDQEQEYENGEAIEGIITKALYQKLISLYSDERDKRLENYFKIYDFIQLNHLECKQNVIFTSSYEHALKHLNKIEVYKTPKDKIISIINCCKIVSSMVCQANKENSKPTGADDFLPVLIYIVLKAKPQHPITNIEFIRDFRSNIRLRGEEDYYFTAYDSAINFLENLQPNHLKIDSKEFQSLCEENTKKIADEAKEEASLSSKNLFSSSKPEKQEKNGKITETEMIDMQNTQITNIKNKISEIKNTASSIESKKFNFANRDYMTLSIREVNELLIEHKTLLFSFNELKKKIDDIASYCEEMDLETAQKGKRNKKIFGLF